MKASISVLIVIALTCSSCTSDDDEKMGEKHEANPIVLSESPSGGGFYYLRRDQSVPSHLARVTWLGDVDSAEMNNVEYFYDSTSTGNGRGGFDRLSKRLWALPAGSTIVIFPWFNPMFERGTSLPLQPCPFSEDSLQELRDLADKRGMQIVLYSGSRVE